MRRWFWLLVVGLVGVCSGAFAQEPEAGKPALVGVVESPLAEKWLERAGIAYSRRTRESLEGPIAGVRLLVLPLEFVSTPAAVRNVQDFSSAGGKVVAFYWGTLAAGADAYPMFQLSALLGVRPVGWAEELPQPLVLEDIGAGAPPSMGKSLTLPRSPATVVEPLYGTRTLARWTAGEGSALRERSGAVFLRDNVLYLTTHLLRPGNDRIEARELFFWALQRCAPDFGPGLQARDRIVTAAEACAAMTAAVRAETVEGVSAQVEEALTALNEARTHLSRGRALRASLSADRARALARRVLEQSRRMARR